MRAIAIICSRGQIIIRKTLSRCRENEITQRFLLGTVGKHRSAVNWKEVFAMHRAVHLIAPFCTVNCNAPGRYRERTVLIDVNKESLPESRDSRGETAQEKGLPTRSGASNDILISISIAAKSVRDSRETPHSRARVKQK